MKNSLVVVVDLGAFKAYKLGRTPVKKTPRLELIEEFTAAEAHDKLVDKVTDYAGRYRVPNSKMAMSYGERAKIGLEMRKRSVKQLARRLEELLERDQVDECLLAASKEINHPLLEELRPQTRAKIVKNLQADLTKVRKEDLLGHFSGSF